MQENTKKLVGKTIETLIRSGNFEPNSKEENAIYHACLEIDTMSWYGGEFFDIDDTIITFQHYSNFIKFEYYWDFTCWKWIFKDVSSCEKCERN